MMEVNKFITHLSLWLNASGHRLFPKKKSCIQYFGGQLFELFKKRVHYQLSSRPNYFLLSRRLPFCADFYDIVVTFSLKFIHPSCFWWFFFFTSLHYFNYCVRKSFWGHEMILVEGINFDWLFPLQVIG